MGLSLVPHALEAELAAREWDVPPGPTPGPNENVLQNLMEAEIESAARQARDSQTSSKDSTAAADTSSDGEQPKLQMETLKIDKESNPSGFILAGILETLLFVVKLLWNNHALSTSEYSFTIPAAIHTRLASETRKEAETAGLTDVRPSHGDITIAWLLQCLYGKETKNKAISLMNIASLRSIEWPSSPAQDDNEHLPLRHYIHNCTSMISYPPLTTSFHLTSSLPLHELAYQLTKYRTHPGQSSRIAEAIDEWTLIRRKQREGYTAVRPVNRKADEMVIVANLSLSRATFLDWSPAGGGRTVTHFMIQLDSLKVPGMVNVNGRLENGDLLISTWGTREGRRSVEEGYRALVERFGGV
ncbi:hypothetical protein CC2G_011114 [Coprinopsis cinerea AmutBmut pab1-1]|nr:hypothetical protein CC2G_011114 [Coprinopsis cinerea AmutBmut pab1-1]